MSPVSSPTRAKSAPIDSTAPRASGPGLLVITAILRAVAAAMRGFDAAMTLVSASSHITSMSRAITVAAAWSTSVGFDAFASTSSMPSLAATSRPSFTFASALGSAGFHTAPILLSDGFARLAISKSFPTG